MKSESRKSLSRSATFLDFKDFMTLQTFYFMTLKTFLAIFFLFVFLIAPVFVLANSHIPQNPFTNTQLTETSNIGKAGFGLGQLISSIARVVNWFSWFIAVVAVAMGLYAAFLYLTARGDAKQISDAHKTLVYAIIGIAVAILAFSIVTITKTFLGLS